MEFLFYRDETIFSSRCSKNHVFSYLENVHFSTPGNLRVNHHKLRMLRVMYLSAAEKL